MWPITFPSDERFAGYSIDACEDQQHTVDVSAENITIIVYNAVTPRTARICKCAMFGDEELTFVVYHRVISSVATTHADFQSRYVCYRSPTSSYCLRSVPFVRTIYSQTFLNKSSPIFHVDVRDTASRAVLNITTEFHRLPIASKYFSSCNYPIL